MNVDALIAYITSTPLTWIIITLSAYKAGILIYEKTSLAAGFLFSSFFIL